MNPTQERIFHSPKGDVFPKQEAEGESVSVQTVELIVNESDRRAQELHYASR